MEEEQHVGNERVAVWSSVVGHDSESLFQNSWHSDLLTSGQ